MNKFSISLYEPFSYFYLQKYNINTCCFVSIFTGMTDSTVTWPIVYHFSHTARNLYVNYRRTLLVLLTNWQKTTFTTGFLVSSLSRGHSVSQKQRFVLCCIYAWFVQPWKVPEFSQVNGKSWNFIFYLECPENLTLWKALEIQWFSPN